MHASSPRTRSGLLLASSSPLACSLTHSLTHSRSLSGHLSLCLNTSSAIAISDVLKERSLKDGPGAKYGRVIVASRVIRGARLFWPLRMLSHTHSTPRFLSVLFSQGGLRWACLRTSLTLDVSSSSVSFRAISLPASGASSPDVQGARACDQWW